MAFDLDDDELKATRLLHKIDINREAPPKPIIFLDVDGVLNNTTNTIKIYNSMTKSEYLELLKKEITPFDKTSLRYLAKLIGKFGGEVLVVITSTWRLDEKSLMILRNKIEDYLEPNSWNVIIDKTISVKDSIRGKEIEAYFKKHNYLRTNYVIIDDDDFDIIDYPGIPPYNLHFVKCNHDTGFKRKEYKRALKILRGGKVESYRRNI